MSTREAISGPLSPLEGLLGRVGLDTERLPQEARVLMAEVLGTFGLVLFCAGSGHVNWWADGNLGMLGVGLINGAGVAVMIFAFWSISGAHLNPAVSLGLWLTGRLEGRRLIPYIAAQIAGALIAGSVLHGLFRNHTGEGFSWLGATRPGGPLWQTIGLEIVLTFFLVYAILLLAERRHRAPVFAVAVGLYIAAAVSMGGDVSGASMNPARSFGPAALGWYWADHWVYWVAPAVGALFAAVFHTVLRERGEVESG